MPALLGTCWQNDAWSDDAWASDTWAASEEAVVPIAMQSRTTIGMGIGVTFCFLLLVFAG